jgi:hypothetical protein
VGFLDRQRVGLRTNVIFRIVSSYASWARFSRYFVSFGSYSYAAFPAETEGAAGFSGPEARQGGQRQLYRDLFIGGDWETRGLYCEPGGALFGVPLAFGSRDSARTHNHPCHTEFTHHLLRSSTPASRNKQNAPHVIVPSRLIFGPNCASWPLAPSNKRSAGTPNRRARASTLVWKSPSDTFSNRSIRLRKFLINFFAPFRSSIRGSFSDSTLSRLLPWYWIADRAMPRHRAENKDRGVSR